MKRARPVFALAFSLFIAVGAEAATELEQRAEIEKAAEQSFLANDFARLENMSGKYRTDKSRTGSGLWHLSVFYAGLVEALDTLTEGQERDPSFDAVEVKTRQWAQEFPESPSAHIVHSHVLIRRAWAHRGGGYASRVKPESWAPFREYIATARANLERYKAIASVDPAWYEAMLLIARAQDWDRGEFDALLDEALQREPLYYQTYFSALEFLLPKWHGDIESIEDFALDAANRTKDLEGFTLYTRIYWYASQSQFKNDIFNNSLVEWPRFKEGFENIIGRYPDEWNLNHYARFACLAGDKAKTRELLKRIDTAVVVEAWVPLLSKTQCAAWASRP